METHKKLIELHNILTDKNYTIFGHGTGWNNFEAIPKIFEKGLRASHTSLFYTTIGLEVDNCLQEFKKKLDNWPHLDSENIILIRLPNEYFNIYGDSIDLYCEKTGAFVNQEKSFDGKITYYLDPKFIIGAYNRNSETVLLNPKFEEVYTKETILELKEKYKKVLKKTKEKNIGLNNFVKDLSPMDATIDSISSVEEYLKSISTFDKNTKFEEFDNIDWQNDFPSLENEANIKR